MSRKVCMCADQPWLVQHVGESYVCTHKTEVEAVSSSCLIHIHNLVCCFGQVRNIRPANNDTRP